VTQQQIEQVPMHISSSSSKLPNASMSQMHLQSSQQSQHPLINPNDGSLSSKALMHPGDQGASAMNVRFKVRNQVFDESTKSIKLNCQFQPYDSSNPASKDQYSAAQQQHQQQQSLQKSSYRRDVSNSPHGATENGHGFP
jgi:hypothetical protein